MSDEFTAEGGRTCGSIRYRMASPPFFVNCCHCRWRQRQTGSVFVINAMIESDRLEFLHGEPELIPTPLESGQDQLIARCPICHVALWSRYAGAPAFAECYVHEKLWPAESLARREILLSSK